MRSHESHAMKFSIIPAAFDSLRKGEAVSNPELWKHGGAALQVALAAFILSLNSLAKAAGYDLQLTPELAGQIAAGVVAFVGVFVTYVSSKRVGILPAKQMAGSAGDGAARGDAPAAAPVGGIGADTVAAAEVWARRQAGDQAGTDLRGGP
jgi:hypothetical protein